MCVNLRQKEFHIRNKPVAPALYHALVKSLADRAQITKLHGEFNAFRRSFPERYHHGVRIENVSGNYLVESKNAFSCFDSHDLWDGMYASQTFAAMRDFLDCNECGGGELICNSANSGPGYNIRCCFGSSFQVHDLDYCIYCEYGSAHLFGCIGLKRSEYCILNKQYQKEEYEVLVPKIIAHMKATGEWGEYFPPALSDFPYNLTQAQVHHPLTKSQALKLGFNWEDAQDSSSSTEAGRKTPPHQLSETTDDILKETLCCTSCGKNYRIQKLELALHQQIGVALSDLCFHCRHSVRHQSRTRREIFERNCNQCSTAIKTAYPPTHPQPVFCERCFAEAVD